MSDPEITRPPDSGAREHEDQRDGEPPKPSTAPHGSESSQNSDKTATHPGTGEPTGGKPERP